MCRLFAFSGKTKKEAVSILENMLGTNTDGVGICYVENNQFVVKKYPYSLESILNNKKKNKEFLNHLPSYNGITLVHLRAGNVGCRSKNNTHPWIIGEGKKSFCWMHNGTFSSYGIVKLALSKFVHTQGETDSEICGHLLNLVGIKKFTNEIGMAGVFMKLNLDGTLDIVKTSGELTFVRQKGGKMLIASEFDFKKYPKQLEALVGYYKFDRNLRYITHKEKKSQFKWLGQTAYEGSFKGKIDDDEDDRFHSPQTVTTWDYDKKLGRMVKKIVPLKTFREIGMDNRLPACY